MEKGHKATHEGELEIGNIKLKVAVLSDGRRVIYQKAVFKAFGRPNRGIPKNALRVSDRPPFVDAKNLQPFISRDLEEALERFAYLAIDGSAASGFDADILPLMCKMYLDASDAGVLHPNQKHLVDISKTLLLSLSRIGMIALIDEATGYQYEREKVALQKILQAYLSKEIVKWQMTFTDEFYLEIFRLWDLKFTANNIKKRPGFIGGLTNKYIYDQLPEGVLCALKKKVPKSDAGNYKYRLHQGLSPDVGREHLKQQITKVTTLMKISATRAEFDRLFERMFKTNPQPQLEQDIFEDDKPRSKPGFDKKLQTAIEYRKPESFQPPLY